jgi:PTH1 family peptidyl-tRNA hydrolase
MKNNNSIKLIVGLRNPGSAYEKTRHNAGAWFVESIARRYSGRFKTEKKLHSECCSINIDGHECRLLLPNLFMNQSGSAIRAASKFYKLDADEILIVHDELDLEAGIIKFKAGGGHGGHNGLRDIMNQFGKAEFYRLRVGIGHPGHKDIVHKYVLSKPSQADKLAIHDAIDRALSVLPDAIDNMSIAMNQLHS